MRETGLELKLTRSELDEIQTACALSGATRAKLRNFCAAMQVNAREVQFWLEDGGDELPLGTALALGRMAGAAEEVRRCVQDAVRHGLRE